MLTRMMKMMHSMWYDCDIHIDDVINGSLHSWVTRQSSQHSLCQQLLHNHQLSRLTDATHTGISFLKLTRINTINNNISHRKRVLYKWKAGTQEEMWVEMEEIEATSSCLKVRVLSLSCRGFDGIAASMPWKWNGCPVE